jgi:ketosteroid isomerase-like protein
MSMSDADTLREAYEALNRGDADAALAVLHPDAEWHESAELPDTGVYRGRESIRAFLAEYLESWERFHQEVEEVVDAGSRIGLILRLRARGRRSGVDVDARYAHVWTMEDGRGVKVEGYADPEAGRAALM